MNKPSVTKDTPKAWARDGAVVCLTLGIAFVLRGIPVF